MRGKRNPRHIQMGHRLREERTRQGLSLRALAEKAGVSKTTPNAIEMGHYTASLAVVEDLAKALQVSPAWLAFGQGPRELPPVHFRSKATALAEWLEKMAEPQGMEAATLIRAAYGLGEGARQLVCE